MQVARTTCVVVLTAAAAVCALTAEAGVTVTIDQSTRHQTMTGWETIQSWRDVSGWPNPDAAQVAAVMDVIDRAVNEVGINRIRLEIRSGVENNQDYFGQYKSGLIPYQDWREQRYATVDDDGNPNTINWSGFHFTEMDDDVDNIVLPLKQKVEANGEQLYVNLCYVAFTGQIVGGTYHHDDPGEYAEFVLATYLHLQNKYGWVPDTWEVLLEPDNVSQWNGTLLGQAILAAAARLEADSYTPRFVAPSNTNMGNAVSYFDAMAAVLGSADVTKYVAELCYHRYGGVSSTNLQNIADRGVSYGIGTAMLEWWSTDNTHWTLVDDLTTGRNSAWERGVLLNHGTPGDRPGLYAVDSTGPTPVVQMNLRTRNFRQFFKWVRTGAERIGASSSDAAFVPLAFVNTDGKYTVVIATTASGPFDVQGLPAGTYGLEYSTSSEANTALSDQAIGTGQAVAASIPAAGVITVYAKPGGPPVNVAPDAEAGPDQTVLAVTFPASVTLDGTVTDDGLPDPPGATATTWTKVSGPGSVTFGDEGAVDTTAALSTEGVYVLRLTADDGELQATDEVTITVHADTDGDSLPDSWEMTHFGDLDQLAGGDPDGDGLTNLEEYTRGNDPTDPLDPPPAGKTTSTFGCAYSPPGTLFRTAWILTALLAWYGARRQERRPAPMPGRVGDVVQTTRR